MQSHLDQSPGRGAPRTSLASLTMKGQLRHRQDAPRLPFVLNDVSESGFGVWVPAPIEVGDTIELSARDASVKDVQCEVVWCERDERTMGYRCGLRSKSEEAPAVHAELTQKLGSFAVCC